MRATYAKTLRDIGGGARGESRWRFQCVLGALFRGYAISSGGELNSRAAENYLQGYVLPE